MEYLTLQRTELLMACIQKGLKGLGCKNKADMIKALMEYDAKQAAPVPVVQPAPAPAPAPAPVVQPEPEPEPAPAPAPLSVAAPPYIVKKPASVQSSDDSERKYEKRFNLLEYILTKKATYTHSEWYLIRTLYNNNPHLVVISNVPHKSNFEEESHLTLNINTSFANNICGLSYHIYYKQDAQNKIHPTYITAKRKNIGGFWEQETICRY